MLKARDVALYFLAKEPSLFTDNLISRNGRDMYEGNFRVNKYLHIAQNIYIAKTGSLLFEDPMYAYANGGVSRDVQKNYIPLKRNIDISVEIPDDIKEYLDCIASILHNADVDELLDISHQDNEWAEKNKMDNQKMDPLSRVDEYREQYKDILTAMEMGLC